ncbi:MAG: helix-turn-helix domain-containing protein [Thermoproteales archaeon]|nr:helix-turn-helix domain-containing protein [Thermoproteales archaeon]
MKLFKHKKKDSHENNPLLVQYIELLDKLRNENTFLKRKIDDAERRLDSILKIFFPNLYSEKKPKSLDEMIELLVDGLDEMRNRDTINIIGQEASEHLQEPYEEIDHKKIMYRLARLSGKEKKILGLVLEGYCSVNSVSDETGLDRRTVGRILRELHEKGFIDVLNVRTPSSSKVVSIYFPSPHGEVVCEILYNMPWSLLHANILKDKGMYVDNKSLIETALNRLRHAGYKVISEREDPQQTTFRYDSSIHRADLVVYAFDKDGNEVKIYVECESMSNPIKQFSKMLDAYYHLNRKIYVIVSSSLAKRMMLQRIAYWAWHKRDEPEGFVFEVRIESIDRVTRLGYMPRYIIVRPGLKDHKP